jgi:hypothetical protein
MISLSAFLSPFSMPIIGTKFKLQILIVMIAVLSGWLKTSDLAKN